MEMICLFFSQEVWSKNFPPPHWNFTLLSVEDTEGFTHENVLFRNNNEMNKQVAHVQASSAAGESDLFEMAQRKKFFVLF